MLNILDANGKRLGDRKVIWSRGQGVAYYLICITTLVLSVVDMGDSEQEGSFTLLYSCLRFEMLLPARYLKCDRPVVPCF